MPVTTKAPWSGTLLDRPRCIAMDSQGKRCVDPVVWDEEGNRPLSTRCPAHGGLEDAALLAEHLPDHDTGVSGGAVRPLRGVEARRGTPGRPTKIPRAIVGKVGKLASLGLAGILWISLALPAFADYESAVAAYERGDYRQAEAEFERLAAAGDTRAEPYLDRLRGGGEPETEGDESVLSTIVDGVSQVFGEPETSSGAADSEAVPDAVEPAVAETAPGASVAVRANGGASGQNPDHWEPWSPFDESADEEESSAPAARSEVAVPPRGSVWSVIFHLPGDATVIGLQYAANFMSADTLARELRALSGQGDKIALSLLAAGWWLVIVKGLVGLGLAISRAVNAGHREREQRTYG